MDRRDEILRLQMEVIRGLARDSLSRIGEDLWGPHEGPETRPPVPDAQPEEEVLDPPPGYPRVPDIGIEASRSEGEEASSKAAVEKEDIDELRNELDSYIGLGLIKEEVDSLINLVTVNSLRERHGLKVRELSLHMVFSGNPGTGKTMIARLMSRIYHSLGILNKGHLVEVDRGGLVAGYVGQTAIKTGEVIKKALGGVLFIDEAYALTSRGGHDYGQEAVETLLKAMEDHRENLIVIVAGYRDLMRDFVRSNPGLESRFNRFLYFPDYTEEELAQIFLMRCANSGYTLEEKANSSLHRIIREESRDRIAFGNARGVRNLFERAVMRQANRLAKQTDVTREQLMQLLPEDLHDPKEKAPEAVPPPVEGLP